MSPEIRWFFLTTLHRSLFFGFCVIPSGERTDGTVDQAVDLREFVENLADEPLGFADGHIENFLMNTMFIEVLLIGRSGRLEFFDIRFHFVQTFADIGLEVGKTILGFIDETAHKPADDSHADGQSQGDKGSYDAKSFDVHGLLRPCRHVPPLIMVISHSYF